MERKIVEPNPVGIPGVLTAQGEELVFEHEEKQFIVSETLGRTQALGLGTGDRVVGCLQCYRGWTAQPAELVERWLREQEERNPGDVPIHEVRPVFRVMDFELLSHRQGKDLSYRERKSILDDFLRDQDTLQKNPYFLLDSDRCEAFLEAQPARGAWQATIAETNTVEAVPLQSRSSVPERSLDLCLAGGWFNPVEIEQRMQHLNEELTARQDELNGVRQERDKLQQQHNNDARLRQAGHRYLEQLQVRGERCLQAIHAEEPENNHQGSFLELFSATDVPLDRLEERVRQLESELEQLFPTHPLSRATTLEVNNRESGICWEAFQI